MDWMYDGMKIQKEDYLLGKKVDKKLIENTNNDTILPPQICPTDNTFCQVDMTKKILEDPLVNLKKRELECTQKILKNPMRLKKQQNNKPEKHTIEDHQLDMILVSRLKSYEKAGLDLAKILSITKHKEKKEHKSKDKVDKSSSEDDEKLTNKQKKNITKSNHSEDRKQYDKRSFEYKDYRRNENKNRNERHRSVSSLEGDLDYSRTNKLGNEYGHHRNGNQKYNQSKLKHSSIGTDKDTIQNFTNRRNEYNRSSSEEKHKYKNDRNKYKNNQHTEEGINKKYSNSTKKEENPKYKQLGDKNREKRHYGHKRHKSCSDRESEEKIPNNNTLEHNKYNFKSNEHPRSNNSDRKYGPAVSKESKNSHVYHKKNNNRRSRSESPHKEKKYQKTNEIIKNKHKRKSSNSSSSDDEKKKNSAVKHISKLHSSTEFQSGSEKHTQHDKSAHNDRKDFGLIVPKSNNSKKSSFSPPPLKIQKNTGNARPNSPPVKKKKLTDEEMEQMRKEMMKDAKIRDKERSSNVKRYRKEDKKEEEKQKPYSKEFLIKTLAHAASQVSVERSIKSNVNKLQKNHSIAD